jgi:hypothetical protein
MNEQMKELREKIEATMNDEKENLEAYDPMHSHPDMYNCQGWVEALAYVLRQIDVLEGEEE